MLVPVLGRPHRVAPLVASLREATPERHRVLFLADRGDHEQIAAVQVEQERRGSTVGLLVIGSRTPGARPTYAAKINAGVAASTEQHIFTGADDLAFRPGWYAEALAHMRPPVQVVGVNDLGTRRVREGRHATSFLVNRSYVAIGTIDHPGRLMHEGYEHNFCDDELAATARARGVLAFATGSVVEHLHPHFGKAEDDDTYRLGRSGFARDRATFNARRSLWAQA